MKQIVLMQFGSHVYGTNLPTSDLDFKGVFIPSRRDILLGRAKGTIVSGTKSDKTARNEAGDVDTELFSLHQYLKLLMEGQTVALDMMFTPISFYQDVAHDVWWRVRVNQRRFFSKNSAAFVGYCRTQANKYGIKGSRMGAVKSVLDVLGNFADDITLETLEQHLKFVLKGAEHIAFVEVEHKKAGLSTTYFEVCNRKFQLGNTVKQVRQMLSKIYEEYGHRARQAMDNEGIDWKALMHATRVIEEAKEFLATGFITQPRPEREILLKIRKGEMPYKQVAEIIEEGVYAVAELEKTSILPDEPDYAFAEDLVAEIYESNKV